MSPKKHGQAGQNEAMSHLIPEGAENMYHLWQQSHYGKFINPTPPVPVELQDNYGGHPWLRAGVTNGQLGSHNL